MSQSISGRFPSSIVPPTSHGIFQHLVVMTGRMVVVGAGLGVVLWFFLAVYFGVLVEAAVPRHARYLREMASAALFPMSVISALVMVRQGLAAPLVRFTAALAAGGVLWFGLAAVVGTLLVGWLDPDEVRRFLPAVNAGLLVVAFGVGWQVVRRWGADALDRLSAGMPD